MTFRSRRPVGLALALLLAAVLVGCNALQLWPSADHTARETVPGLPSKHSVPVSQFVFISDFEIQRNWPLFRELSQLREQVYRELHLPPSSTKVLVYLFEDQERYQRFMKAKYPELPAPALSSWHSRAGWAATRTCWSTPTGARGSTATASTRTCGTS